MEFHDAVVAARRHEIRACKRSKASSACWTRLFPLAQRDFSATLESRGRAEGRDDMILALRAGDVLTMDRLLDSVLTARALPGIVMQRNEFRRGISDLV